MEKIIDFFVLVGVEVVFFKVVDVYYFLVEFDVVFCVEFGVDWSVVV